MIDFQTASQLVSQYLIKMEGAIGERALALLPQTRPPQIHLVIARTVEYEFVNAHLDLTP